MFIALGYESFGGCLGLDNVLRVGPPDQSRGLYKNRKRNLGWHASSASPLNAVKQQEGLTEASASFVDFLPSRTVS